MSTIILQQDLYSQSVGTVAKNLLGKILVRETVDGITSGRIVETEAYLHAGDSACHGWKGQNNSNAAMFGPPGRAYVYPIHGKWCFNTVTQAEGEACAVLIRSLEPIAGIETIRNRRNQNGGGDKRLLTTGPARLCQALAIDRQLDHHDLSLGNELWIETDGFELTDDQFLATPRIGVTSAKGLELRFVIRGNEFVSGSKKLRT